MAQPADARETGASSAELKFLVAPGVGAMICSWARARLQPDPHGTGEFADQYRTAGVYFDTAGYDVFHRRGSFGRSKFRARRYGCGDSVFLERKLTRPGLVTKRRTLVSPETLGRLERANAGAHWAGDWFEELVETFALVPQSASKYRLGVVALGLGASG